MVDELFAVEHDIAPTLVLGLGNVLLADEGVGVHVVEQLKADHLLPSNVEVLDGGTSGMALLQDLIGREQVIVVDAVRSDCAPGTVMTLRDEQVPAFFSNKVSPHQLALSDVLAVLDFMGGKPREITLIGIEPECLDTQLELSDTVHANIPLMVQMVIQELRRSGVEVGSMKHMSYPTNSVTKPRGYDATHRRIFE